MLPQNLRVYQVALPEDAAEILKNLPYRTLSDAVTALARIAVGSHPQQELSR